MSERTKDAKAWTKKKAGWLETGDPGAKGLAKGRLAAEQMDVGFAWTHTHIRKRVLRSGKSRKERAKGWTHMCLVMPYGSRSPKARQQLEPPMDPSSQRPPWEHRVGVGRRVQAAFPKGVGCSGEEWIISACSEPFHIQPRCYPILQIRK